MNVRHRIGDTLWMIDFTDPVESEKKNRLKGACFVAEVGLRNYKKKVSQFVCSHWPILGRWR